MALEPPELVPTTQHLLEHLHALRHSQVPKAARSLSEQLDPLAEATSLRTFHTTQGPDKNLTNEHYAYDLLLIHWAELIAQCSRQLPDTVFAIAELIERKLKCHVANYTTKNWAFALFI